MEALRRFRAYEGETEGRQTAILLICLFAIFMLCGELIYSMLSGKRKEHKDTWKQGDAISFWNTTSCRRAEIPSAGGLASARFS